MSTIVMSHNKAKQRLEEVLTKYCDKLKASQLANIFVDAELDGVSSHGLARFPRFIDEINRGFILPNETPTLIKSFAGWEMWNGNAGAGPLNALHCTERVANNAQQYGLACLGLRNTNHWLRPGYYAKVATKKKCAFIAWSNTMPNMRAHGSTNTTLGNTPITIGLPASSSELEPTFLDMALSQFSYGKMQSFSQSELTLPVEGGYDEHNQLTKNPNDVIENQSASAIGFWKGSALAMLLDLLGVFLGGGKSVLEIGEMPGEQNVSQVFLAIALDKLWQEDEYAERLTELKQQLKMSDVNTHLPAESLQQKRQKHLSEGFVLDSELWNKIMQM